MERHQRRSDSNSDVSPDLENDPCSHFNDSEAVAGGIELALTEAV